TLVAKAIVHQRKAQGLEVYDFGLGETKGDLLPEIREAACRAYTEGNTKYGPPAGMCELREEIIRWLGYEEDFTKDNVVVTVGAKQALFNTIATLCSPGDIALLHPTPWVSYIPLIHTVSARPELVIPKDPDASRWKVSAEDLEHCLSLHPQAKLFLVNSPCNPTGQFYTEAELLSLVEVCVSHKVFFVLDRLYWKVLFDGKTFPNLPTSGEAAKWIIHIDGLSKNFRSTGGLRIGWTVAPEDITEAMIRLQSHTTSGPSMPAQHAALAALQTPYNNEMIVELETKRALLQRETQDITHVHIYPTEASYYSFWDVRGAFGKTTPQGKTLENSFDVSQYLLHEYGVVTVPGEAFEQNGFLRLMFHIDNETIRVGMNKAKEAFAALQV
ncbi:MAG: aminotransferase class I/II-fold pyridoxal phosphate-dependent enzyme, partial [Bdellovibrionales bacterium]|nr:aminotransferase class I/II-fold pyridoxal phosphate-dependent enzyme [Bdellovibrionales bacterium]